MIVDVIRPTRTLTRSGRDYLRYGDFPLAVQNDTTHLNKQYENAPTVRRVINTDLAPIYSSAIPDSKKEGTLRTRCRHRPVQYLNNILEQDHRAIKRRVNAKQGFREFQALGARFKGTKQFI